MQDKIVLNYFYARAIQVSNEIGDVNKDILSGGGFRFIRSKVGAVYSAIWKQFSSNRK